LVLKNIKMIFFQEHFYLSYNKVFKKIQLRYLLKFTDLKRKVTTIKVYYQ
jgi:hypothetical protein